MNKSMILTLFLLTQQVIGALESGNYLIVIPANKTESNPHDKFEVIKAQVLEKEGQKFIITDLYYMKDMRLQIVEHEESQSFQAVNAPEEGKANSLLFSGYHHGKYVQCTVTYCYTSGFGVYQHTKTFKMYSESLMLEWASEGMDVLLQNYLKTQ